MAACLVVAPVPPFAIASVPASVTAPVVAVAGVKPVVPPLMLDTFVSLESLPCAAVPEVVPYDTASVPEPVIVPPVRPVPPVMLVTVPCGFAAVESAVTLPLASTLMTGTNVLLPMLL
jgi:hypothetical protein